LVDVRLPDFPEGLFKLIKNLAAADHISVEEEIVRLLLTAMYGPEVLAEAPPPPSNGVLDKPAATDEDPSRASAC
jgi:hypothetical protein